MSKNYVIINEDDVATFISEYGKKEAIGTYAYIVGLKISESLFCKSTKSLTIDETVELFNDVCLGKGDRIKKVLSDFSIVYGDDKDEV